MTETLIAKNKLGIVDGTIVKPETSADLREAWLQCDALVKEWLKTTMDKEVRSAIRYAKTSREMWVDLETRFGKGFAPRAYELRKIMSTLRQEKLYVSTFYTKLRAIWEEMQTITPISRCICGLCTCGVEKKVVSNLENDKLFDFLMGLVDAFANVKTHILSMKLTPPLVEAYMLVATEEQHKQITASRRPQVDAAAFQDTHDHLAMELNRRDEKVLSLSERKEIPRCSHCQKKGHTRESCYKLIGWSEHMTRPKEKERTDQEKS
ncbi:unnamed protein product [Linum trigynum]|uniref:Retrotransposon gag domain-containing protein n=1 Tax=Linum trigynum TaxID=586398 RepID=A0AAV2DUI1_9ROSI